MLFELEMFPLKLNTLTLIANLNRERPSIGSVSRNLLFYADFVVLL